MFWAIRVRGVQVFALIALLAGLAAGQRISGLITNQQGNPVVGVLLRWTHPQGQTTTVFSEAVTSIRSTWASSLWWRPTLRVPQLHAEPNYPNPFNPGTTIPFVIGVIPSLVFLFSPITTF